MDVEPLRDEGERGRVPHPLSLLLWPSLLVGVAAVTVLLPAAGVVLLVQWVFAQRSRSRASAFMLSSVLAYGTVLLLVALGFSSVLWPGAAAVLLALAIGLASRTGEEAPAESAALLDDPPSQPEPAEDGIWSRARILAVAERELERARRYGRPFSIVVIAVEGLYGAGSAGRDEAVRAVAERVKAVLRRQDAIGQIGEDRLLAVLSEADANDAWQAALRFEGACARPLPGQKWIEISTGLATGGPDGGRLASLVARAERALEGARAARCHRRPAVTVQRAG